MSVISFLIRYLEVLEKALLERTKNNQILAIKGCYSKNLIIHKIFFNILE